MPFPAISMTKQRYLSLLWLKLANTFSDFDHAHVLYQWQEMSLNHATRHWT